MYYKHSNMENIHMLCDLLRKDDRISGIDWQKSMPVNYRQPTAINETTFPTFGLPTLHHSGSLYCTNSFSELQIDKNKALNTCQDYSATVQLSQNAKKELVWWSDNLKAWNGKALVSGEPELIIDTDASFLQRVGSFLHGFNNRGTPPGTTPPYKLSRVASQSICPQSLCEKQGSNASPTVDGQHLSSSLHQKDGRDKVPNSSFTSKRSLGMVFRVPNCARSPTYPRSFKCRCRQGVPGLCSEQRLETNTPSAQSPKLCLGPPRHRSLCHPM